MLNTLEVLGLRGFTVSQTLTFPQPDGKPGSGLLTIVGSNNSGKTTIVEAMRSFIGHAEPSFSQGRRNLRAGDKVFLNLEADSDNIEIESTRQGTSETLVRNNEKRMQLKNHIFPLQSRRAFNPFFYKAERTREQYTQDNALPTIRTNTVDAFSYRLFTASRNPEGFNALLFRALGYELDWTIDLTDAGQYYLRINAGDSSHGSEGLGEGVISLFFVIDALYDSQLGDFIIIDEPELSLHPAIQKRLFSILLEESRTKQIVLTTHSPYFLDLNILSTGGSVVRVVKDVEGVKVHQINHSEKISRLMLNVNNPHIFGLEAREIFFSDDNIILTEGQEDVLYYKRLQEQFGFSMSENFYGWGVGGAGNMEIISTFLQDLGYKKVVGILDGDKRATFDVISAKFPNYKYYILPVDDIRDKESTPSRPSVGGLLNSSRVLKPDYNDFVQELFRGIDEYFKT